MTIIEQTYQNLEKLLVINKELETKCFYLVFGGFAIDGILGRFTRPHKDIDLLCFRRDIGIMKEGLKNSGFEMIEITHPKETELTYKLVSADKQKSCTCHILDEVIDNCFEISFYHFLRQRFPLYLIAMQSIALHNIVYPAPTKEFLYILKKQEDTLLNEIKKNNPEKYVKWENRHRSVKSDLKLLKELDKSNISSKYGN